MVIHFVPTLMKIRGTAVLISFNKEDNHAQFVDLVNLYKIDKKLVVEQ